MNRSSTLNSERGAVAPMLVFVVSAVLAMAGLAFDGSRILAARRDAIDTAQSAARAGAQAVDAGSLRAGAAELDPSAAVAEAEAFLALSGHEGSAIVQGGEVRVTVTVTTDLALLSIVGINQRTVTGIGTARPVRGTNQAET